MSSTDFAQRLVQALGPDTVATAEQDVAPWLPTGAACTTAAPRQWCARAALKRSPPAWRCASRPACRWCARRQYRPVRRRHARPGRGQRGAEPGPDECRARHRHDRQHPGGRGRLHPGQSAPRGAGRRPAAAAEPGGRGLQPDRRQRRHQRRRRERGALRHGARAGAGPGSRAAHGRGVPRPAHAAQGQHRLRPQAAPDRLRGYAGRDHRRGAAPVPARRRALGGAGGGGVAGPGAAPVRAVVREVRRAPAGLEYFRAIAWTWC